MERAIACYIRVSTDRQDYDSQRHALERWIADNGGPDVLWFEETISGAAKTRPEFERMMGLVDDQAVGRVVVFEKSRLGRTMGDRLMTLARLTGADCELVSLTEETSTGTEEGLFLEAARAYVAAVERRQIRQRTVAGIQAKIARGVAWGGSKIDPSALRGRRRLTDDQEAAVLSEHVGGMSMRTIARRRSIPLSTVQQIVRRARQRSL